MAINKNRRKIAALKKAGMLPFEIREIFSSVRITDSGEEIIVKPLSESLTIPYMKKMIRNRARAHRLAIKQGISPAQYMLSITENLYENEHFTDIEGNPDFWAFFREERQKAIDDGSYDLPRQPKRKPIEKGNVARQRQKRKDRQEIIKNKGYLSIQTDFDGNIIGGIIFNPDTGKFEAKFE